MKILRNRQRKTRSEWKMLQNEEIFNKFVKLFADGEGYGIISVAWQRSSAVGVEPRCEFAARGRQTPTEVSLWYNKRGMVAI